MSGATKAETELLEVLTAQEDEMRDGGYPSEIVILDHRWLIIASADENSEPHLSISSLKKELRHLARARPNLRR